MVGNTLLFVSQLLFLFSGAPENSPFFKFLQTLCILFIPIYLGGILLINTRKTTSGLYPSIIPSVTLLTVAKKLFDNGLRYKHTEVCFLFTGSDFSSHAGAYAFAKEGTPEGRWSLLKNFGDATTFGSQPAFVLPVEKDGRTRYYYFADRWGLCSEDYFTSTYVVLEIQFDADGMPCIEYTEEAQLPEI
jgi:hypothetical protein